MATSLHNALIGLALAAALSSCSDDRPARISRTDVVQVVVNATDLAAAFEENEIAAADLYGGKLARLRGHLAHIDKLPDGKTAVTFRTSIKTFRPVRCILDLADTPILTRIQGGEELTVVGKVEGFSKSKYFVTVADCWID